MPRMQGLLETENNVLKRNCNCNVILGDPPFFHNNGVPSSFNQGNYEKTSFFCERISSLFRQQNQDISVIGDQVYRNHYKRDISLYILMVLLSVYCLFYTIINHVENRSLYSWSCFKIQFQNVLNCLNRVLIKLDTLYKQLLGN